MKIKPSKKLKQSILEVSPRTQPRVAAALFKAVQKLPAVRLEKILVTTDFSLASQAGVRCAVALAQKLDAALELVHVVEPVVYFSGTSDFAPVEYDADVFEQAEKQLARLAEQQSRKGFTVTPLVREGKPFHEITALARERRADLIVIATRGRTGLKRMMLGNTAERVVRHAPCPVLTVPFRSADGRNQGAAAFRLRKMLVPIDFSETSAQALPSAATLAGRFDAEIVLLHVAEPLLVAAGMGYGPARIGSVVKHSEQFAKEQLAQLGEEVFNENISVRTIVRTDVPYRAITATARSLNADLIVLTTHGFTGLKHVLMGSTAERVVRHADCPVMVVRGTTRVGKNRR